MDEAKMRAQDPTMSMKRMEINIPMSKAEYDQWVAEHGPDSTSIAVPAYYDGGYYPSIAEEYLDILPGPLADRFRGGYIGAGPPAAAVMPAGTHAIR
jgi:hypothetical protein